MPLGAIVLVSFFVFGARGNEERPDRAHTWHRSALASYGLAVLAAIPFMNQAPRFVGPPTVVLGGLDFSDLVSFVLAGTLFYFFRSLETPPRGNPAEGREETAGRRTLRAEARQSDRQSGQSRVARDSLPNQSSDTRTNS